MPTGFFCHFCWLICGREFVTAEVDNITNSKVVGSNRAQVDFEKHFAILQVFLFQRHASFISPGRTNPNLYASTPLRDKSTLVPKKCINIKSLNLLFHFL